ncbi:stage II sporulation protein M [Enterococcus mediterraneensis]|uniref:stage II sporulation protein M n=1 Tax=Enterococcus mediterraneensis TaxID=2364791 RepID=UPI000F060D1A|nr:stage II sporulation protein M [Enterococcus mediterraneensis]
MKNEIVSVIQDKAMWRRAKKYALFSLVLITLSCVVTFIIHPDLNKLVDGLGSTIQRGNKEQENEFISYLKNNGFKVPRGMFLMGLIPVPWIYLLNLIFSSIVLGIALSMPLIDSHLSFVKILLTVFTYAPFEIFAYCIFAALIKPMNNAIIKNLLNLVKKGERVPFFIKLKRVFIGYLVLVLPLIIISGFIEAYVADFLYKLF